MCENVMCDVTLINVPSLVMRYDISQQAINSVDRFHGSRKSTKSDISKFILGCEAWGNETKEIILRLSN